MLFADRVATLRPVHDWLLTLSPRRRDLILDGLEEVLHGIRDGAALARRLERRVAARVRAGRVPAPPAEWAAWLARLGTHDPDEQTRFALSCLSALDAHRLLLTLDELMQFAPLPRGIAPEVPHLLSRYAAALAYYRDENGDRLFFPTYH